MYDPITGVYQHDSFPTHMEGAVLGEVASPSGLFISPQRMVKDSLNLVLTRNALGDWSWNRTSGGAETYILAFELPHLSFDKNRNYEVDLMYQIGVADLTSNAATVRRTVFANAAAPVVADPSAAPVGTLAVANAATPYCTRLRIPPVLYEKKARSIYLLEWTIVMQNNGTLRVYGAFLHHPA